MNKPNFYLIQKQNNLSSNILHATKTSLLHCNARFNNEVRIQFNSLY